MGSLSLAPQRYVFHGRRGHECSSGGVEYPGLARIGGCRPRWNRLPKKPYWFSRSQCRDTPDRSSGLSHTNRTGVEENQPNPGRPAIRRNSEEISIVNLALARATKIKSTAGLIVSRYRRHRIGISL